LHALAAASKSGGCHIPNPGSGAAGPALMTTWKLFLTLEDRGDSAF